MIQVDEDSTLFSSLIESTNHKLRSVELKIKEGESKLMHKKLVRSKTTYLIGRETSEMRRRERETIAKARNVISEIEFARSSPDFLDDETLDKLGKALAAERERTMLAKIGEANLKISRELECNIW
jgi:hypothetical protein